MHPRDGPRSGTLSSPMFLLVVGASCLVYLGIELLYITRVPYNADEVNVAGKIYRLKSEIPYVDFRPYKTVLGFYVQLPILFFSDDSWVNLMALRGQLALVTAASIFVAAIMLTRHYSREAVCLGLFLLISMTNFLERSFEVRVDMLSTLLGLFSLLLLLGRRFVFAGVLCGLCFFFSQKGVYYILSTEAALAAWVIVKRDRSSLGDAVRLNLAMLAVLAAYMGAWSVLSSLSSVSFATFVTPRFVAFTDIYDNLNYYWLQTLSRNPFFYAIALVHLLQLGYWQARARGSFRDSILLSYSVALLALCVWHKQPWPYFFVMLAPTLFVLHVGFHDRFLPALRDGQQLVLLLFLVMAIVPLQRFQVTLEQDNRYQHQMMKLAEAILDPPAARYIDGMNFVYKRGQAGGPLRWLDTAQQRRLNAMSEEEVRILVGRLEREPVKLVFRNSRTTLLPLAIRAYFFANFARLAGNLHIYAPTLPPGGGEFELEFDGLYEVIAEQEGEVTLDGRRLEAGQRVHLRAGRHRGESQHGFRLKLHPPEWEALVDPRYREERADFMFFRYRL